MIRTVHYGSYWSFSFIYGRYARGNTGDTTDADDMLMLPVAKLCLHEGRRAFAPYELKKVTQHPLPTRVVVLRSPSCLGGSPLTGTTSLCSTGVTAKATGPVERLLLTCISTMVEKWPCLENVSVVGIP